MQCGRRPSFFLAWGFFYSVFSFLEKSHFLLYPLLVGIFCWAIFMPFWAFSYPLSYGGLFPLSSLGPLKGHLQPSLRFSLFHCASRIWRKCKCLRSDTLTKVKLSEDWRGDQKELSISYLLIFLFQNFFVDLVEQEIQFWNQKIHIFAGASSDYYLNWTLQMFHILSKVACLLSFIANQTLLKQYCSRKSN